MVKFKSFEENTNDSMVSDAPDALDNSKMEWGKWAVVAIIAIIIVAAVVLGAGYKWSGGRSFFFGGSGTYQAVFLDNNQVYFGKLSREKSDQPILRDIYYLRVAQALQPPTSAAQIPDVSLVKLGTELHGPEDEMRINKEHIIFIENLKPDGQVMKAIKSFQEFQQKQRAGQ